MSLIWGGLFDIGPPPSNSAFWSPPHRSHRIGTSVDIDRRAYINGSYIVTDRIRLDRIARGNGGRRVIEPTIHYEF
jgi:hypothetical protein